MLTIRIRSLMWFAAGVVLAVAMLAGSLAWRAYASTNPADSSIVPVAPERILDTRDPNNVGLDGPFVSAVSQKLQVTGTIPTATGDKVVVPEGATAVLLNVTAVLPTGDGFVSIRPGDAAGAATTSSLNFTAGEIVPNAVQVALPTSGANAGQIDITYDAFGVEGPTTEMLIDVVGYASSLDNRTPIARSAEENNVGVLPSNSGSTVLTVTIEAPVAGLIQAVGGTLIDDPVAAGEYGCSLNLDSDGSAFLDTNRSVTLGNDVNGSCTTNGAIAVPAGTHVVGLQLQAPGAAADAFDDATLDVVFFPTGELASSLTAADAGDDS